MAWQYIRGAKGQFAGSTGGRHGGGGGGGGGKGGGAKGGGKKVAVVKVSKSGKMSTHPGRVRNKGATAAVSPKSRVYLQKSGPSRRGVAVTQIKNGRTVAPRDSHVTRSAVGGRSGVRGSRVLGNTRQRVGTPVGGNRNIRFVSRGHAVARSATLPVSGIRAAGRAHSTGVRTGARMTQTAPRSGYLVAYGPRVKG